MDWDTVVRRLEQAAKEAQHDANNAAVATPREKAKLAVLDGNADLLRRLASALRDGLK